MKLRRSLIPDFSGEILIAAMAAGANPIVPPQMPVLSEIRATASPQEWTVEVDCSQYPYLIKYPVETDTFTLFCWQSTNTPPVDSMRIATIPESVNSSGILLLTPKHFPDLRITRTSTVFLAIKGSPSYQWKTQVLTTSPNQTTIGYARRYCCQWMGTQCMMWCTDAAYKISLCPSIGASNSSVLTSMTGTLINLDSFYLPGIRVCLMSSMNGTVGYDTTDAAGRFSFISLDTCSFYSLSFSDIAGNPVSDTTVSPIHVSAGRTSQITVMLDYDRTAVSPGRMRLVKERGGVRLLASNAGGRIVFAAADAPPGKGTVEIFAANGTIIRSIPFAFAGQGTYTVGWDGRDAMNRAVNTGTYVCRVTIVKGATCTGHIVWR
jgi:hypothetical protein